MPSDNKKDRAKESTFPTFWAGFFVTGLLVLIVTAFVDLATDSKDGQHRCSNSYIVGASMTVWGFICICFSGGNVGQ